jgi:hypothetical protein
MVPFTPLGPSAVVAYTDDSTDTSITISTGGIGMPNVLYCVNEDQANIVAVSYSFDSADTNASVPSSGANGIGAIIPPYGYAMIAIPQAANQTGNLYVSAAGHSGAGNVYITPGVLFKY